MKNTKDKGATITLYYRLTKPGIIYGNMYNAGAAFLFASHGHIQLGLMAATLGGMAAIIAAACVFNNYIDRDIDRKMARTKQRALASRAIPVSHALAFGAVLGVGGFAALALWTNSLTVLLGVLAVVDYVVLYGWSKRKSVHGTLVGTVAGALPPVAAYTAVTNQFDVAAVLLLLILTFWQMAHFYAIALYRQADYAAAGIPVMPVKRGAATTKRQIVLYIIGFVLAASLLTVNGYTGYIYLLVVVGLGAAWLWKGWYGLRGVADAKWGGGMFGFSLIVIAAFDVMLAVGSLLP